MYGIYANIWGILMVNVTIYGIHGSYGYRIYSILEAWLLSLLGGLMMADGRNIRQLRPAGPQSLPAPLLPLAPERSSRS